MCVKIWLVIGGLVFDIIVWDVFILEMCIFCIWWVVVVKNSIYKKKFNFGFLVVVWEMSNKCCIILCYYILIEKEV